MVVCMRERERERERDKEKEKMWDNFIASICVVSIPIAWMHVCVSISI